MNETPTYQRIVKLFAIADAIGLTWPQVEAMSVNPGKRIKDAVREYKRGKMQPHNQWALVDALEAAVNAAGVRALPPPPRLVLEMRRARGRYPECRRGAKDD